MPTINGTAATALIFAGPALGSEPTIYSSHAFGLGTGVGVATVAPSGSRWRVVVCETDGTPLAELEHAVLGQLRFQLNQPETWTFTILQNDPKASFVLGVPFRECQIWRGDQCLSWGPMVRVAVDRGQVAVQGAGALWHLTRRFVGKANRTNYVTNGDFELASTPAGWGMAYNPVTVAYSLPGAQAYPPHHEIVSTPTMTGRRALRLENDVVGVDAYASQQFDWTVDGASSPKGDVWTVKGYVYVESFDGPAGEARGLVLIRYDTTQLNPDPQVQAVLPGANLLIEVQSVPINEDTPIGVWTRMEAEFTVPPTGTAETLNVRLYAPKGVVYWDAVSFTRVEKLAVYNGDQAEIAAALVQHAQDAAYGKSDINIDVEELTTGVRRTREYVHSEHPNIWTALQEFTSLDDGFDFSLLYTAVQRIFRMHYPRRGNYLPGFTLEAGVTAVDWTWSFDGEAAANSVIVLGTGNGSDREEGAAVDTSVYAEGLTLEEVFVSPPETLIDALENIASEELAKAVSPVSLQVRTPAQSPMVGLVWPGDTLPVDIDRHSLTLTGVWRVATVGINFDGSLELTLNYRADDQP